MHFLNRLKTWRGKERTKEMSNTSHLVQQLSDGSFADNSSARFIAIWGSCFTTCGWWNWVSLCLSHCKSGRSLGCWPGDPWHRLWRYRWLGPWLNLPKMFLRLIWLWGLLGLCRWWLLFLCRSGRRRVMLLRNMRPLLQRCLRVHRRSKWRRWYGRPPLWCRWKPGLSGRWQGLRCTWWRGERRTYRRTPQKAMARETLQEKDNIRRLMHWKPSKTNYSNRSSSSERTCGNNITIENQQINRIQRVAWWFIIHRKLWI